MKNLTLPSESIIQSLYNNYGISVTTLTPLLMGADINALTYKAKDLNHKSYFIKIKRKQNHDIGVDIVDFLNMAGIQQIIPPIKNLQGQSIQPINDFNLIIYPFIENQNGFNKSLDDEEWMALGKALRKIHDLQIPEEIQKWIKTETYSPKWRDFVSSLYDHLDDRTGEDDLAEKMHMFLKNHKKDIQRLVERAEFLAEKIHQISTENVLCHSDIHGGNVLIAENGQIYIVDWDEPIMAPKERDLMFIGGGVANVWNNPYEVDLFYKGYGKTKINKDILAYYRYERIVQDIAEYAQVLFLTTNSKNREEMYKHFTDIFETRGVVEIAFRTDESYGDNK